MSGYETRDVRAGPLALAGVGLLVVMGVGLLAASGVDRALEARPAPAEHPMAGFREGPAAPLLQARPAAEREAHEAWEERMLASYGWVDRPDGIVRIPVDRALRLFLEEQAK